MNMTEPPDSLRHDDSATPDGIRQTLRFLWDVIRSVASLFHERPAQIIGSTFFLLMLWGFHGKLDLLMTEQMQTLFEIQKTQLEMMQEIKLVLSKS